MGQIYGGIKKEIKDRCATESGKKLYQDVFLELWPSRPQLDTSVNRAANFNLLVAANATDSNVDLIPSMCCGHQLFEKDLLSIANKHSKKVVSYVRRALDTIFGDALDFMCARYKTLGTCEKDLPHLKAIYESNPEYPGHGALVAVVAFAKSMT